jgi:RNA polymerase sigma factor (sigma-70 family)
MSGRARALATPAPATIERMASASVNFDEAFTLYHRVVFRTARSYVRDNALAEDVTQEVFLRLYNHSDSAPGEDLLRAWLLRVTINVSLNMLRGHNRSVARDEEYVKLNSPQGETAPAAAEDLERQEAIAATRRALDKVKEPMRSCLLLKQQGLSYKEIAVTLSLNESSIGSLIARGRKEFVRVYGKIGGRP